MKILCRDPGFPAYIFCKIRACFRVQPVFFRGNGGWQPSGNGIKDIVFMIDIHTGHIPSRIGI